MRRSKIKEHLHNVALATSREAINVSRTASEVTSILPSDFFHRLASLPKGSRVLEIGIGKGKVIDELRKKYPHLKFYGTNFFKRGETPQTTEGNYVKAEGGALPFRGNSFDLAFSIHTFQYVPDKAQFLREVHRVLKAGGEGLIHGALMSGNFVVKTSKYTADAIGYLGHPELKKSGERDDLISVVKKRPKLILPIRLNLQESKALGWQDERSGQHVSFNPQFISVYTKTRPRKK